MTAKRTENPIGTNAHSRAGFPFVLDARMTQGEFIVKITSICEVTNTKHADLKIKARIRPEAENIATTKTCDRCHKKLI